MNITHGLRRALQVNSSATATILGAVADCGGRSGTACHALRGCCAPIAAAAAIALRS
jgi:hypothetical protein